MTYMCYPTKDEDPLSSHIIIRKQVKVFVANYIVPLNMNIKDISMISVNNVGLTLQCL